MRPFAHILNPKTQERVVARYFLEYYRPDHWMFRFDVVHYDDATVAGHLPADEESIHAEGSGYVLPHARWMFIDSLPGAHILGRGYGLCLYFAAAVMASVVKAEGIESRGRSDTANVLWRKMRAAGLATSAPNGSDHLRARDVLRTGLVLWHDTGVPY